MWLCTWSDAEYMGEWGNRYIEHINIISISEFWVLWHYFGGMGMVYYKYVLYITLNGTFWNHILLLNSLLDIFPEMQKFRSFVAIKVLRKTFLKGSESGRIETLLLLAKWCSFLGFKHFSNFFTNFHLEYYWASNKDSVLQGLTK